VAVTLADNTIQVAVAVQVPQEQIPQTDLTVASV
jgi:hypothetical protein